MTRPSLRSTLRLLAARPAGAHSSDPDLTDWSTTRVCTAGNRLVSEGKLHKAQIHPRETRYFATAEQRDAYVASHTPKPKAKPFGLRWRASAPRALWPADAEAIVPPGLVIQKCPSHAPRFSEHTFAFVHG